MSPQIAVHAPQSAGQIRQFSIALHTPSPQCGQLGSHVVPGGHSGEHVAQQSGSAQPASPSPSLSTVSMAELVWLRAHPPHGAKDRPDRRASDRKATEHEHAGSVWRRYTRAPRPFRPMGSVIVGRIGFQVMPSNSQVALESLMLPSRPPNISIRRRGPSHAMPPFTNGPGDWIGSVRVQAMPSQAHRSPTSPVPCVSTARCRIGSNVASAVELKVLVGSGLGAG